MTAKLILKSISETAATYYESQIVALSVICTAWLMLALCVIIFINAAGKCETKDLEK